MSILLDALKKSDAQRQLGDAPNLQTPLQATRPNVEMAPWLPVLAAISVFALVTWLGMRQFAEPDWEAVHAATNARLAQEAAAAGSEPQPPANVDVNAPASARSQTAVERFSAEQQATEASTDQAPLTLSRAVSEYQPPPAEPAARNSTAAVDREQRATLSSLNQDVREQASRQRNNQPVESSEPQPISYFELPQGVRDGLPDMKISVLVYAEQAADRFLLIDGQRLTEQQELQPGLTLVEIRRQGAVFSYRKYRFLMKY